MGKVTIDANWVESADERIIVPISLSIPPKLES